MKPMFALHKTEAGDVLTASSFKHNYELSTWLRSLDIRAGDTVEFREAAERPEFDEIPSEPAFITEQPPEPLNEVAADNQPF